MEGHRAPEALCDDTRPLIRCTLISLNLSSIANNLFAWVKLCPMMVGFCNSFPLFGYKLSASQNVHKGIGTLNSDDSQKNSNRPTRSEHKSTLVKLSA